MRLLAFIEYAAVVAGVIAMFAGNFFALPKGFQLGVFLVGAGIALGGIEGVATRRMPFRSSDDACEAHAGVPALIIALMALLIGAAIIGAAYLLADGTFHSTLNHLKRRPAAALAFVGALLVGVGILMTLNPQGRTGIAWRIFLYAPRALIGVVIVLSGIAGFALGAFEWSDPHGFDRLVRNLPRLPLR